MARPAHVRTKRLRYTKPVIGLVVIVVVGVGLWIWHDHHHKTVTTIPVMSTSSSSSKPVSNPATTPNTQSQSSSPANTKSTIGASGSNENLVAPYGTFVSNHKPSLSGSSSPSQEESVCTTSAGASCYIEFIQGSTTKKLASQTTDGSGSASWTWDVKQAGLSQGKWTITATASIGDQTKSTVDQLSLEVQP